MTEITDEYMFEMLATSKTYALIMLKTGPNYNTPDARATIFEHGRRNFELRAGGLLSIVCRVADDSEWAGIGIFDTTVEEATRIIADDPAVKAGILEYEVHPVLGFPGDALPA